MIQRNRNPSGRIGCIVFGMSQLLDGAVRVASGGFLHTTAPLAVSREQARRYIQHLKHKRITSETK